MEDTITINEITYHKLVTFTDCAAKTDLYGNEIPGAGGYLPWAFVDYDMSADISENTDDQNNPIQTFAPRYFVQKVTEKCISFDMLALKTTPAGCENEDLYISKQKINQKNYYKLICKKDIKYGNISTSFDYSITSYADGGAIGNDKTIHTYFGEGNDPNSNHIYEANTLTKHKGVHNTWSESLSVSLQPPRNKDSYFKYGVYKTSGGTPGDFNIAIRVTSDVTAVEAKKQVMRWPGIISSKGDTYYRGVNIYNNDGSVIINQKVDAAAGINYALFWSICKIAIFYNKKIGLYMTVHN